MTTSLHRALRVGLALLLVAGATSYASAAFTQLANALLSVDLNGGGPNDARTQLGWDSGTMTTGVVAPGGVLWTPWAGALNQGGDGGDLPNSLAVGVSSISKAFGAITATISLPGLPANYTQAGGIPTFNSRDRGDIATTDHAGVGTNNQFGRNMYRDLLFTANNQGVRSKNYIKLGLTGLMPNTAYQFGVYSYDRTGAHSMQWTATAPPIQEGYLDAMGNWQAPPDMQTITWVGGAAIAQLPAEAVFNVVSDGNGESALWGWGAGGTVTDPANNNFQDTTYINGFQIAKVVPEPASAVMSLLGMAALASLRFRRR